MRWFTSDLHLGHRNIIEYCRRPFGGVDHMNEALIDRWNECVAPDDEVWVLGDVAMGTILEMLPLVGLLDGRKILVAGNHDRCWAGRARRRDPEAAWTAAYLEAGFAEVHQGAVTLELGGEHVLACHFPYEGDSQDADRHVEHRPADDGLWLLHGHVHDAWQVRGRQINVGVDVWHYRPVAEATLTAIITGAPDDS